MKKRLDVLLVERGLAESRTQAQALVLAGLVPGFDKPGTQIAEDVELTVESDPLLDTTALGVVASEVAWDAVLSVVG